MCLEDKLYENSDVCTRNTCATFRLILVDPMGNSPVGNDRIYF